MREILFRGKRVDNGEWVYGDLIYHTINNGLVSIGIPDDFATKTVVECTVGQYTGLTDKDGKKIFEDDILLYDDKKIKAYFSLGGFEFSYDDELNDIKPDESAIYYNYMDLYGEKLEVIGNIWDSPELLE